MTELVAFLILHMRMPPEYVMNMEMYEAAALMKHSHLAHKSEYECARLGAYVTAQCNSTKKLKPTDICRFGWESDESGKTDVRKPARREAADSAEAMKALAASASALLGKINNDITN